MSTVIKVENLGKQYRLGEVGTGTISHDLNRFWAKLRGKEDPFAMIGETNDRSKKGASDYVWALKDINFDIQQGDAVGIIGRNGAGKSTLLKILSRTTLPTTGSLKIKGRIASLLEVGTGFHPEMTGRENIFQNGALLGMRKNEIVKKFDEIVDFSGCERYIDTPVKRYSSGMYVRLAFAVAAHLESEILIVDEVLAVGDAEFQKKCLGKMNDVSKGEGRTVLFVSHNMGAIEQLCKNVMILNNGTLDSFIPCSLAVAQYHKICNASKISKDMSLKNRLSRTSGKARFENIICISDNKEEKWIYYYDENKEIIFTISIEEEIPDLLFYFALKNATNGDIITNGFHEISHTKLENGKEIIFSIAIPKKSLRANQYEMYFALGNLSKTIWYDVIDENVGLPYLHISPINNDIHKNIGFFDLETILELKMKNK